MASVPEKNESKAPESNGGAPTQNNSTPAQNNGAATQNNSAPEADNIMPTTAKLMKMLETSPNRFRDIRLSGDHEDISFNEYLLKLMEKKKVQIAQLLTGACISKTYAYQFVNGERLPGRDIVLRMAFFLKLKVDETQRLLTLADKGILYPKIRRDAAILFCLQKKMTLDEANFFLEDIGEVTLL